MQQQKHLNNSINNIKKFLKTTLICLITTPIFYMQPVTAHKLENYYKYNFTKKNIITPIINSDLLNKSFSITSNQVKIYYPEKIKFDGNVKIKYNDTNLTADKIVIFNNKNNINTIYADGNIKYNNHQIILSGSHANFFLKNKNFNLYHGTYHFPNSNIHGSAKILIQKKNNHHDYTILKHGNCTACSNLKNNHWNILGSEIIYDHYNKNINIWNAYLQIYTIPIFYSPFLSISLNKNNTINTHLPNIQYSNIYGVKYKIPCFFYNLSKFYINNISAYYIHDIQPRLQTKINYLITPGIGLIKINLINQNNYIPLQKNYCSKWWNISWNHNSIINKKWHFNSHYITSNYPNLYDHKKIKINNCANQKFLYSYNNKYWNSNIAYLGHTSSTSKIIKKNHSYTAAPQLELNINYFNKIKKQPFNFQMFNQLTRFVPDNFNYPETIRIHLEPTLNFPINSYWSKFNIETKLKITHYEQNNTIFCNKINTQHYHIQKTVNRIIPYIKIYGETTLKNKKIFYKNNQPLLNLKLQYLYIPYYFQNHIGIYDTDIIHINHHNIFRNSIYSGLDRIQPTNQITNKVTVHFFNKENKFFYTSIGYILNFKQPNQNHYDTSFYIPIPKMTLISGMNHWNINNHWNIHTDTQYNIQNHKLLLNSITIKYIKTNNQIFKIYYRYINNQYIKNIVFDTKKKLNHKEISQFGIYTYYPLHNNWKISCAHHYNIKSKKSIDQIIGIQYYTECWSISALIERNITNFNKKIHKKLYDNTIQFNIQIYNSQKNYKPNPYKILNTSLLPYQYLY